MNKRMYGMAPGGRMSLDKAANRRRTIWQSKQKSQKHDKATQTRGARMIRCTGVNCPMQNGTVEPKNCIAETCPWRTTPMTNADRIRAMTDDELDKFLCEVQLDVANYCGGVTQKQEYPVPEQRAAWLNWLKQEVSDNG